MKSYETLYNFFISRTYVKEGKINKLLNWEATILMLLASASAEKIRFHPSKILTNPQATTNLYSPKN